MFINSKNVPISKNVRNFKKMFAFSKYVHNFKKCSIFQFLFTYSINDHNVGFFIKQNQSFIFCSQMQKMFPFVKNVLVLKMSHIPTFVQKSEKVPILNLFANLKIVRVCQKIGIEKRFPLVKICSQIHTFFPF